MNKMRLFVILWLAGMAGILSLLLLDLGSLIAAIPQQPGQEPPVLPPMALLKLASVIQPAVLMSLAVLVGVFLASRVGLHAPAAEALANKTSFFSALKPQILPGIVAGIACGIAIVVTWLIAKPFLTAEFIARAEQFNALMPNAVRMLYGGITEEILLRWGVMTTLVWAQWRILQGGEGKPKPLFFILAIVLSALLFGIGHLPVASILNGGLTLPLALYVITANSLFGLFAGFLYHKHGLESAIVAHMTAHLILITALNLNF